MSTVTYTYGDFGYGEGPYGGGTVIDTGVTPTTDVGIGLFPPPEWKFAIGPWYGPGPERSLLNVTERNVVLNLDEPSTATFTFAGSLEDAKGAMVRRQVDDLWVWRGPELLGRFRIDDATFASDDKSYTLTVTCVDYRTLLNRYLLDPETWYSTPQETITFDGKDVSDAIKEIITKFQSWHGGNLGLKVSTTQWPKTGVVLGPNEGQIEYEIGQVTSGWDEIAKLIDGRAELVITPDREVKLYVPTYENSKGEVLDFGGMVSGFSETQGTKYANVVRQSGINPGKDTKAIKVEATNLGNLPSGRIEVAIGDETLMKDSQVVNAAKRNLTKLSLEKPSYTLDMVRGRWEGLGHIGLGDVVKVEYWPTGIDDQARVVSISLSVDASNRETVAITAGRPRRELSWVLANFAKQLRYLSTK